MTTGVTVTAQSRQAQQSAVSQLSNNGQQSSPVKIQPPSIPSNDIIARAKIGAMSVLEKINQVRTICHSTFIAPQSVEKHLKALGQQKSMQLTSFQSVSWNAMKAMHWWNAGPQGKGVCSHESLWDES